MSASHYLKELRSKVGNQVLMIPGVAVVILGQDAEELEETAQVRQEETVVALRLQVALQLQRPVRHNGAVGLEYRRCLVGGELARAIVIQETCHS